MEKAYAKLTVFFEDPFWVGLYERGSEGRCEFCRIVFGPEPRDYEIYDFLLQNWHRLRFGPSMAAPGPRERTANPKRMQRQIKRTLETAGTGTKAQQALKLQRSQGKEAKKRRSREEQAADQARRFALRREKQREKHKGH